MQRSCWWSADTSVALDSSHSSPACFCPAFGSAEERETGAPRHAVATSGGSRTDDSWRTVRAGGTPRARRTVCTDVATMHFNEKNPPTTLPLTSSSDTSQLSILTPKLRKNFGQSHFRTALSRLKRSKVTKKGSKVRIFRGSAEHLLQHANEAVILLSPYRNVVPLLFQRVSSFRQALVRHDSKPQLAVASTA